MGGVHSRVDDENVENDGDDENDENDEKDKQSVPGR